MNLKEILIPIQHEVEQLEGVIREHLTSHVPFVEGVVEYVIRNGGKRIRPVLTILASKLSGYQGNASVYTGAAIEFMHTASLLHDDVIDNATLRRGRASINRKWGNHVSVLVGDFFFCKAMNILVRQGDLKIIRMLTDAMTATTEGEMFEITKSNDFSTSQEDYLRIVTGKTAALMGAACQAGAILGNVSEDYEMALKRFGLELGIAFQLIDDVLDYTSHEEEFGKNSGIDLREGKLTLPLLLALKKCGEGEVQVIKNALIADEIEPSHFRDVLKIVEKYDGALDTTRLAKNYVQKAKERLNLFKHSLEKETLMTIADYVVLRRN